jgi:hypothetical protein
MDDLGKGLAAAPPGAPTYDFASGDPSGAARPIAGGLRLDDDEDPVNDVRVVQCVVRCAARGQEGEQGRFPSTQGRFPSTRASEV